MKNIRFFFCFLLSCTTFTYSFGQPGAATEVKKPAKYENRTLKSEKTGEKKFTLPRHVMQNTVTHYNYYFNANNRLNEVITQAKTSFKDDYTKLLPFHNYDLETTAQNKTELDSIIYKCTAGILLHDLRNDWIDNMYLLLGKAYLFRKDFDSAAMTFQYLNFAYAPKEDGGYDVPIGSNSSNESGEFSISTNEKGKDRSLWTKLTGHKPSRNESFVWQIRNHIEKDELPEAAGIIEILRNDPKFPARLRTELNQEVAYWFYKQQVYDSAAYYLSRSLKEADNNQEQARWEYLIGQLYSLSNKREEAINYYGRSIKHTNDPVMDVYARLNSIKINGGDDKKFIQQNIDELVKMARRDKYINYRDIIYYAAATIELERNNADAAQQFLLNSVKYSVGNASQRSESFMLLGDLNYNRKEYTFSSNFYDSTDENSLTLVADKERLNLRRPPLKIIAENDLVISNQDSLQALAKMLPAEREAIIKKRVRQIRKAQGLKEEDSQGANPAVQQVAAQDLFADSKNADFYFYNAALKSRGFSEFKSRWGQRPNVDNWRRMSAVNSTSTVTAPDADLNQMPSPANASVGSMSYEGLLSNVPLTEEQLQSSNKKIMDALFTEGKTFLEKLEDYPTAIDAFEELLRRFPNTEYKEEALFNLAYAYRKTGNLAQADLYKNQLSKNAPDSKWAKLINGGVTEQSGSGNNAATKKYENIYNLFIEGNFAKAIAEKRAADSIYGNSFWTPQLLFIESIYYIKQQEDSTAIHVLNSLATLHSSSPMAPRAQTMIDVLKRRKEIEDYLTNLNVTRNEDVTTAVATKNTAIEKPAVVPPPVVADVKKETPPVKKDTVVTPPPVIANVKKETPPVKKDTVVTPPPVIADVKKETPPVKKNTVVTPPPIIADVKKETPPVKKDTVVTPPPVIADVKKETPPVKKDTLVTPPPIIADAKKETPPVKKDTVVTPPPIIADAKKETPPVKKDTLVTPPPVIADVKKETPPVKKDTVAAAPPRIVSKNFTFIPTDAHYVVVVLDKVDPVYASEARNAFNRFNKERYSNQNIEMSGLKLDDRFHLVLQGPFSDANSAVDYIDKTQPVTRSRILPWLTEDKYSYIVISGANLELLKQSKDMTAYRDLLKRAFPGKF